MFSIRLKQLRKLHKVTQTALAELLCVSQQAVGKWEKQLSTPDPITLAKIAAHFDVSADYLLGIEDDAENTNRTADCMLPIIGTVKAGFGGAAFEEDYGEEPANVRNPAEHFYLLVKGDSMEPKIHDGDLALIRRQQTLENGDLGVVVYGEGEGTLKKIVYRGNTIILKPFNEDYDEQIIMGEDVNNVIIVGKVVETKTKW